MTSRFDDDPPPVARGPRGVLGRGGGGDRLVSSTGTACSTIRGTALLPLVRGRRGQHLPQRARPPCRARARRPGGADLRQPRHRHGRAASPIASCATGRRASPACWPRHGVGKGDRVIIYMPMVPEAVVAMLACARLGAIHSVVFGGFAANELAVRIDDAKPKAIVSASCGIEPGARRRLQAAARRGRSSLAKHKPERCIILQRPMLAAPMVAGRDLDWDEALAAAPSRTTACRSRRPIRSTSSTPRARRASPRASSATTAGIWSRSTGR